MICGICNKPTDLKRISCKEHENGTMEIFQCPDCHFILKQWWPKDDGEVFISTE